MRHARAWLFGLALGASALPALSAGWVAALKNTPAESFEESDLRLFLDSAGQLLKAEGQPEPISWSNPDTGAGGRFELVERSTNAQGQSCKRVRFSVYSRQRAAVTTTWTACLSAQGRWQLTQAR
jgi:hypothetical protein